MSSAITVSTSCACVQSALEIAASHKEVTGRGGGGGERERACGGGGERESAGGGVGGGGRGAAGRATAEVAEDGGAVKSWAAQPLKSPSTYIGCNHARRQSGEAGLS